MDERLNGKVAIVTGAGSSGPGIGNGRAAAILFARKGAKVLLVDLDEAAAQETLDMITAEKGEARVWAPADVCKEADCKAIVGAAVKAWGRLDILLNNVGIGVRERLTVVDVPAEEWTRVVLTNVQSMMLMCKHAIPEMAKAGGGAIVNISSVGGLFASNGNNAYATSKGAILSFTRSLAVDHGADSIRANCVIPGLVATPMGLRKRGTGEETVQQRQERQAADRERRKKLSLLGIEGTGWDVAHAALFFASEESRFITGASLVVDGGQTAKLSK